MNQFNSKSLATREVFLDQPNAAHSADAVGQDNSYSIRRIARRAQISFTQAALIAELLGLTKETRHERG